MAQVGISFVLPALYSFLFTPLIAAVTYLISWKKEMRQELAREFGSECEAYRRRVPLFLPSASAKFTLGAKNL